MIDSIISKVDVLGCSDLPSKSQRAIELTKEILDWIGGYDSAEINRILYHSHDKELWSSSIFRNMILVISHFVDFFLQFLDYRLCSYDFRF